MLFYQKILNYPYYPSFILIYLLLLNIFSWKKIYFPIMSLLSSKLWCTDVVHRDIGKFGWKGESSSISPLQLDVVFWNIKITHLRFQVCLHDYHLRSCIRSTVLHFSDLCLISLPQVLSL